MAEPKTYQTSRGYDVPILAVSTFLLQRVMGTYPQPEPPTYTSKTVAGEQTFPHTAETLETDEDKAAWAAYQQAKHAVEIERFRAIMRLLLTQGMKLPPPTPEWESQMRGMRIPIPEDEFEKYMLWIETEIVGGVADMIGLLMAVMRASNDIPEEAISAVEADFRRAMEVYRASFPTITAR